MSDYSGQVFFNDAIRDFSHYPKAGYHYLDSAATTHKPDTVIEAISLGYRQFSAPVHRASYPASEKASLEYELARKKIAEFINAPEKSIIFTKSATESINLVAQGWLANQLASVNSEHKEAEPCVWVSSMEHNANYLPWLKLCEQYSLTLKVIPMDSDGRLIWENPEIWQASTVLIALTHCSNVLGGANPVAEICAKAQLLGITTLVDAAQSVSHIKLDVSEINCDFLVFSAHKMYGPEGIGALYVNERRVAQLQPLLMGGGIVSCVSNHDVELVPAPQCFEAGSPNLSGALGFAAAASFLQQLGMDNVGQYIARLSQEFIHQLQGLDGVTLLPIGGGGTHSAVISFIVEGVHPHDVAHICAQQAVAMRAGHHCAHLVLQQLEQTAVNRISLGVYNSVADIAPLVKAISEAKQIFSC